MNTQTRSMQLFVITVLALLPALGSAQTGQDADFIPYKQNEISDSSSLTARDLEVLDSKRAMVIEIAKDSNTRHDLDGTTDQVLSILQELLDEETVTKRQPEDLQAMGVVLGDLYARKPDLKWMSYEDDIGRSLAIQIGTTDNVLFPVTMISRLVEAGIKVNVTDIYNKGLARAQKTEHDENLKDIK